MNMAMVSQAKFFVDERGGGKKPQATWPVEKQVVKEHEKNYHHREHALSTILLQAGSE